MNPRLRRRLLLGLAVAAAVTALVLVLRTTAAMDLAEAKSYDLRASWLADPATADSSILIIAIDENSLDVYGEQLGRWPWDRDAYVPLIEYAAIGGARAIVFDLLFREPDRRYPEGDTLFAEALADSDISVLAFTLSAGDATEADTWAAQRRAEMTAGDADVVRAMLARNALPLAPPAGADGDRGPGTGIIDLPYVDATYPLLGVAARSLGAINWSPDRDGVTRNERLVFQHRDLVFPSLPLAAARLLEPDRYGGQVRIDRDELVFHETGTVVPLADGRLPVRWRGPYMQDFVTTYDVVPAFHVLDSWHAVVTGQEPHIPLEAFEGRIVFIAATGAGAFETRATPISAHDPGVIIHATILDNLLSGDFLQRASWPANAAMILLIALLAALLAVVFESATVAVAALGGVLALALAAGVSTFALSRGLWLDLAAPGLAGALAFAGGMVANYLTEGRDRRRVRELFGRYVSPEYVRRLADDHENIRLGGERTPVTLLFSDIRGFTSISERLPAETVIEMLNEYLESMAEVVFRHGGTLDKFIGDAVMAFWNAPIPMEDHARRAAEAALDMMSELDRLNERWQAQGTPEPLRIGIGLNTGEAIVGNIGSLTRKLDYTAIGDTVNLASRLEGLTKDYDTSIIISDSTWRDLDPDTYDVRALDEVKVKGKENAVRIFELKGRKPSRSSDRGRLVTASLVAAALAVGGALAIGAAPAEAQEAPRARWTDWVYAPGAWQGNRLVEHVTRDAATDSLALVARVDFFAQTPRYRAEFRRVVRPDSLDAPVIMVADGDDAVVLTQLGTTPFAEHAAASDPVAMAVLARVRDGRPQPAGPARIVETTATGAVAYVILRRPAARSDFGNELLQTGTARRLGRSAARLGIHAIGGERRQDVVASAGARGVARVRTVDGEIEVMPDTMAVQRLARIRIGIIDLDRFLREGGIQTAPPATPKPEEGP